jgi:signal transduction histidine kinase
VPPPIAWERLSRLLDAMLVVGSGLGLVTVLGHIVEAAAALVDARYAALGVLDDEGKELAEFITVGLTDAEMAAIGPKPRGHGVLGALILDPRPLRLRQVSRHPDSYGFPPGHPLMESFLGVPIRVHGEVFGNLYLAEKTTATEFTTEDEQLLVSLSAAAAIAIENARLHDRLQRAAVTEERERIGRELHDTVIQRLFAIGLTLESASRLTSEPEARARLDKAVSDLDVTVRQIRATIFELDDP